MFLRLTGLPFERVPTLQPSSKGQHPWMTHGPNAVPDTSFIIKYLQVAAVVLPVASSSGWQLVVGGWCLGSLSGSRSAGLSQPCRLGVSWWCCRTPPPLPSPPPRAALYAAYPL